MKNLFKQTLWFAVLVVFFVTDASATTYFFNATNHPLTDNHPRGNRNHWALYLEPHGQQAHFFQMRSGGVFEFNADTGNAYVRATAFDQANGDVWGLSVTYSGFWSTGLPQSGPYDGIFNDLIPSPRGAAIGWNNVRLNLSRLSTPRAGGYHGPTHWVGKPNSAGVYASMAYRFNVPGNYFRDVLAYGLSGWVRPLYGSGVGDLHMVATTTPARVPEPATMALLSTALLGFGIRRRRSTK